MTKPDADVDGKSLGIAIVALGLFFGILECWHQFRVNSGWEASGWFALMILAWIGTITGNKMIAKRRDNA